MATYTITYDVEIDSDNGQDAVFWLKQVIRKPNLELPDHVHSVRTVPIVTEVTVPTPKPKATASTTKPKGN